MATGLSFDTSLVDIVLVAATESDFHCVMMISSFCNYYLFVCSVFAFISRSC